MDASVLQENLASGLAVVTRAIRGGGKQAMLEHVLLTAGAAGLELECNNLEFGIRCVVAANVMAEGRAALPARRVAEYVSAMTAGAIQVTVESECTAVIRAGKHQATIKGLPYGEFPTAPRSAAMTGTRVRVAGEAWQQMVDRSAFAVARNDTRPVLRGVLVQVRPAGVTMVGADGYRLAVARWEGVVGKELPDVVVPAQALMAFRSVADGADTVDVVVDEDRTRMVLQAGSVEMASQLLDGNFPDYGQIVPKAHTTRTVVDTAQLRHDLRVAALFVRRAGGDGAAGSGAGHVDAVGRVGRGGRPVRDGGRDGRAAAGTVVQRDLSGRVGGSCGDGKGGVGDDRARVSGGGAAGGRRWAFGGANADGGAAVVGW